MLQANLFQEQGSEENLPDPVIVYVSDEEKEKMREKARLFREKNDDENYLRELALYPLPAHMLQRVKRDKGMEYLLREKFNLYNAVQEYGKEWLTI